MPQHAPPLGSGDRRRPVALCWFTSVNDGQEHAVLDRDNPIVWHPSVGARSGLMAACGHRVSERRASLFVPPGPRCLACIEQRRALQRARGRWTEWGAELVGLLVRTARMVGRPDDSPGTRGDSGG